MTAKKNNVRDFIQGLKNKIPKTKKHHERELKEVDPM